MLVKLLVPMQLDVTSVRSVVLANSPNHQQLINLSFPIMFVISVTSIVLAKLSKYLMLLNLSVPVTCNSTCKSISNFISDCHSDKRARKLIDVNRKRPHE